MREGLAGGGDREGVRSLARCRQVGRDADRRHRPARLAGPRRPPRPRRDDPVPSAQVHARLAGRGRRRDRQAPRTRGLGRGQVRRDPGAAPQAGPDRPALLARSPRRDRPVPGGRRGRRDPAAGTASSMARSSPGRTAPSCRSSRSRRVSDGRRRRRRSRPRSRSSSSHSMPWPSGRATASLSSRCCATPLTERRQRLDALELPTVEAGGRFARSNLSVAADADALEAAFTDAAVTAQRGPDGQGPRERLFARPPRPRLAEDEEGARDDRLRRRRRRGRSRQAPRRAERLHVRGARHRARPPRHHRQGLQRPDRRRDRRDDPMVRGAHGRPVRPVSPGRADRRRRDRRSTSSCGRTATSRGSACASRASSRCDRTSRPTRSTRSRPSPRCTRASRRAPSIW